MRHCLLLHAASSARCAMRVLGEATLASYQAPDWSAMGEVYARGERSLVLSNHARQVLWAKRPGARRSFGAGFGLSTGKGLFESGAKVLRLMAWTAGGRMLLGCCVGWAFWGGRRGCAY